MPSGIFKRSKQHRINIGLAHKGKILSIETRRRISKAHKGKKVSEDTKNKIRISTLGSKNHFWKGGKFITKHGYLYIKSRNHPNATSSGYVFKHRLVMEKHIKRYLRREEVVHHIDGNPLNNNINNLKLYSSNKIHRESHCSFKKLQSNRFPEPNNIGEVLYRKRRNYNCYYITISCSRCNDLFWAVRQGRNTARYCSNCKHKEAGPRKFVSIYGFTISDISKIVGISQEILLRKHHSNQLVDFLTKLPDKIHLLTITP